MFSELPLFSRAWRHRRRQERRFTLGLPEMTRAETALLRRLVRDAGTMVEFGAGTSTFFALACGVRRMVSVESDPGWIARLREDRRCADAEASGRLTLFHADIGPVRDRGYPVDRRRMDLWAAYADAPWPFCEEEVDVVLVDGRFRVACALTAALRCGPRTAILIHDYAKRTYYHAVEQHLPKVGGAGGLALFENRLRDSEAARKAVAIYVADPR